MSKNQGKIKYAKPKANQYLTVMASPYNFNLTMPVEGKIAGKMENCLDGSKGTNINSFQLTI